MKVLSIGNSFSQDAQRWLHQIAASDGVDLTCANLYIGGCTLERHDRNREENACAYAYEQNGGTGILRTTLERALTREEWDVVTFQQSSGLCGVPESYEPYLTMLIFQVAELVPKASLWMHETWAYERDFAARRFEENYHNDQQEMYERLREAYGYWAEKHDLPLLPVGDAIQYVRTHVPAFDYANGGMSLNRDGYHLTKTYGRYLAGLVWYAKLTGADVTKNRFTPAESGMETDEAVLQAIREAVAACLEEEK